MKVVQSIEALRDALQGAGRVGLVPTMGNLHLGHLALVQQLRPQVDVLVTSIFVNPLQFGANEDLASYPRTMQLDCEQLQAVENDLVFAPEVATVYPVPQTCFVEPPALANELCGAFRPGHFRGVATVVLKLLNLVQPDVAIFGKKDYQQLVIIRQMVQQLNVPVVIHAGETVRAADGLALSSRNGYLSKAERAEAPRLYAELQEIGLALQAGERNFARLEAAAAARLQQHGWQVDYISIRQPQDLAPAQPSNLGWIILAAARLGRTRLIDNLEISA